MKTVQPIARIVWNRRWLTAVVSALTHVLVVAMLGACASTRDRSTDKVLRVMVDPDSVDSNHHAAIQQALFESGRFNVVDRTKGFKALKTEQERQHKSEADRFADREKWSHWGKLYGVGGIVVAHAECKNDQGLVFGGWYARCRQYLSIVDSNTGEIIASVRGESESPETDLVPSWDETVERLVEAYPKTFSSSGDELDGYRDESARVAVRK